MVTKGTPGSQLAQVFRQLFFEKHQRQYTLQKPRDSAIFKKLAEEYGLTKGQKLIQLIFNQGGDFIQSPLLLSGNNLTRLLNALPVETTFTVVEEDVNSKRDTSDFQHNQKQFLLQKYGHYKTLVKKLNDS